MIILDGKTLALKIQERLRLQIEARGGKRPPGLGVVLVGSNPASKTYVASKERSAKNVGFITKDHRLPEDASFQMLCKAIDGFNDDREIDGILIQLPLPKHLPSNKIIERINPAKDVDGLHPYNQGLLLRGDGILLPCTPAGIMRLIDLVGVGGNIPNEPAKIPELSLAGKRAIVIGRSLLVGKPVSLLLQQRNATVVMAHSKTINLADETSKCDIVVAAVGVPHMVKSEWIKPGAIVIDVGINRLAEGGALTGDVDFEAIKEKASAITPVPGGVGPMTVTMLLENTYQAYCQSESI